MKMKQKDKDKTGMLKGFQTRGCLGNSLKPCAKAISSEPLQGKWSQTTAAQANTVCKNQAEQTPRSPLKLQF